MMKNMSKLDTQDLKSRELKAILKHSKIIVVILILLGTFFMFLATISLAPIVPISIALIFFFIGIVNFFNLNRIKKGNKSGLRIYLLTLTLLSLILIGGSVLFFGHVIFQYMQYGGLYVLNVYIGTLIFLFIIFLFYWVPYRWIKRGYLFYKYFASQALDSFESKFLSEIKNKKRFIIAIALIFIFFLVFLFFF